MKLYFEVKYYGILGMKMQFIEALPPTYTQHVKEHICFAKGLTTVTALTTLSVATEHLLQCMCQA